MLFFPDRYKRERREEIEEITAALRRFLSFFDPRKISLPTSHRYPAIFPINCRVRAKLHRFSLASLLLELPCEGP
ncbi:hypothetical protein I7I50_09078 [Histoplasma capsulatum G186AR]|uniref:Uncharacterized protein n=1 Tax=Ajellomyces capsulatus TaxID=5037 RepID=A0A8H7YR01_AJECA|nr:hypothetical protein I7I52_06597 [Histoplasma capsulatum]QSS74058.1 hypothetical protein I7I50_09078 [Histoplasma capsulatum G186AR]